MARRKPQKVPAQIAGIRIIGGRFRGRRLHFAGDPRTRPMKDRLRETVFNLLADAIRGTHALDLFAGTGALGLEAVSRGAARATFCEQHFPTVEIIRQNIAALGAQEQTAVIPGNVFIQFRKFIPGTCAGSTRENVPPVQTPVQKAVDSACFCAGPEPWAVFCSPPYDFYVSRTTEMLKLIAGLMRAAPEKSVFVVEADTRFDFTTLPHAAAWDVRSYPPAVIGIYRKGLGIRD